VFQRENPLDVVEKLLRENIPQLFDFDRSRPLDEWDFCAKCPKGTLLGVIKESRSASIEHITGLMAASTLQLMRLVNGRRNIPFVVTLVPAVGPRLKREIADFMFKYAPSSGWCLCDRRGGCVVSIPQGGIQVDVRPEVGKLAHWEQTRDARLFSDLNRWMFKVLMLSDAPPHLWTGPHVTVATPTDLHRVAKVSLAKAHQFCRTAESAGFLVHKRSRLEIVNKPRLMNMWFADECARTSSVVPVRWIYGCAPRLQDVLCKKDAPERVAVCGLEACRMLKILHTPVDRREIYLHGDLDLAMKQLDLEPSEPHDADFFVRKARFPKSIFQGRLVLENLPVVDVLQAAIDVFGHASRGEEQANYIISSVLNWRGE
jgi:hypothetical protein